MYSQVSTDSDWGETKEEQFLKQTEISDRLSVIKPSANTFLLAFSERRKLENSQFSKAGGAGEFTSLY